jgi:P27 family predicted phage terminase small subunit
MGQRGPKPMSARAHVMRGNASKKPLAELDDEIQLLVETPDCPRHLWPEAKREWKRIGAELEDAGLIAKVDRAELALYCQAWARMVWHEEIFKRDVDRLAAKREAFEKIEADKVAAAAARGEICHAAEWAGGDGLQIPTPNGSFTYNPHWVALHKAAEAVSKFGQSFGIAGPSSRVRIRQSNNYWLPGLEPKQEGGAENKVTKLADFQNKR